MKRKIFRIIVCMLLISTALPVVGSIDENDIDITESFSFSIPTIGEAEQYLTLQIQEATQTLRDSGKPEMPMATYSLDLPFGARNVEITYEPSDEFELDLTKKIKPTPQIVTPAIGEDVGSPELIENVGVYSSAERYPATWHDVKITCGLKSNKNRVTHISLYMYPVQYSPSLNKIYYIKEATLKVNYDPPNQKLTFEDEYDLLIIAPNKFSNALQRLVDHKNSNNVKTFLKTTESIYNNYSGFDKPEQIKYFIKDAIETYNINYVLLVGGLKKYFYAKDRDDCNQGSSAWHVPVRYTNIKKSGLRDPGALCDLYYADIYDGEGNFSSWDSNGDGIYAKWSMTPNNDELDLNLDVYVGRLPCRSTWEVKTAVRKIIQYETITPSSESWYKRMVGISGLNHALYDGQADGEYLTDLAMSYVEDIIDEEVRVYASNEDSGRPIPVIKDIVKAFTNGARFIYFSGHGHPLRWATHPVDDINTWLEGMHMRHMWKFFNLKKLPIVVVGGCHDAQFNISWLNTYRARNETYDQWYWTHGDPGVHCFCWRMIIIPWGGAIASVGGTGLTTSLSDEPNSGNARLATDFFYLIGQEGATTFGEAFSGAVQKFIDENTINLWEAHVVTIWNALGDPSLKLS
ncbi:MAG: hypothetical protein JSW60_04510 [Thermoplasmatales archaeon]|nr:MAG: hypothetical protein JSW60_04510 [Thermoplasmatales archaeon]